MDRAPLIEGFPALLEPGGRLIQRHGRPQCGEGLGRSHDALGRRDPRDDRAVALDRHDLASTRDHVQNLTGIAGQLRGADSGHGWNLRNA
jgi:hypothetical protein